MIHRIRIQNYKSLRDVTVEMSPVTVFIGRSGTGKTNFVSAIRFLRDYLALGATVELSQQFAACKCATHAAGAMEFEVEFDVPGFPFQFVYTLRLGERGLLETPRIESLTYGTEIIFSQVRSDQKGPQWEKQPSLVSPPEPGPAALGRLPGLEEVVVAYTALTAGIGVYAFPYGVLTMAGGSRRAPGLADDGRNFLDVASGLHNVAVRKGITAALRQINSTVISVELDSIRQPQTVFIGHRLGDKMLTLELRQESEGFRRFYVHLLALYQTPPKQTLVFEEPENGIFPGALSLLADEFKEAPAAGRGQVLLTTHSPSLLDHFSADQIRVVELVDLETRIGPLAEEQKESLAEELLHPGELLTVDLARGQSE